MIKSYFIMNGIHSDDLGIHVVKLPKIIRAKEEFDKIKIDGRSGILHEFKNTFENYTKTVECILSDRADIDFLNSFLRGKKEVIFSNERDKKYICTISNAIEFGQVWSKYKSFLLQLDTQPFKYSAYDLNETIELTEPQAIYNIGNFESEPIIEIFGNSTCVIDIFDKSFTVNNVSGSVTINSEIMEVYKDKTNKNNDYSSRHGFPKFAVGENYIGWSVSVSKIIIKPNWRWL